MRYTDKVAIVTGAVGGIGSAIAARLASGGARLILADLSDRNADQHVQATKTAGAPDAAMQACDVAFLGSDDASFVTGASLVVDGGRLAKL